MKNLDPKPLAYLTSLRGTCSVEEMTTMERFTNWETYNQTCPPERHGRPGMAELTDLVREDGVQDADDLQVPGEYDVLFLPGGGSGPSEQVGNIVAFRQPGGVVVLGRDVSRATARAAMLVPVPRPGTLQATAKAIETAAERRPQEQ